MLGLAGIDTEAAVVGRHALVTARVMGSLVGRPGDHIVSVGVGSRSQGHMVGRGCTFLRLLSGHLYASVRCLGWVIASGGDPGCCRERIEGRGERSLHCRVSLGGHVESGMRAETGVSERPSPDLGTVWNVKYGKYQCLSRLPWVCVQAPVVHLRLDNLLLLAVF